MNKYLLHPKKQPNYRAERPHSDFLCKLKGNMPSVSSKEELMDQIEKAMLGSLNPGLGDSIQVVTHSHAQELLKDFEISTEDVIL